MTVLSLYLRRLTSRNVVFDFVTMFAIIWDLCRHHLMTPYIYAIVISICLCHEAVTGVGPLKLFLLNDYM